MRQDPVEAGSVPSHRSFVGAVAHDLILALENDPSGDLRGVRDNLGRVEKNAADESVSVGYSAVDCRRALGKLDDQYLWTGVHLLWTGTPDETLSMAPTRLLPAEARQAMATGFKSAFRDAMAARRLAARTLGEPAIATLAWLLDTPEVRDAAHDSAKQRGADPELLRALLEAYEMDGAYGSAWVTGLYDAGLKENRRFLMLLLEALLLLFDRGGVPFTAAVALERTQVTAPYHRLRDDLNRMLNAFFLLGDEPETSWCSPDRFRRDDDAPDAELPKVVNAEDRTDDDDNASSEGDDATSESDEDSGFGLFPSAPTNLFPFMAGMHGGVGAYCSSPRQGALLRELTRAERNLPRALELQRKLALLLSDQQNRPQEELDPKLLALADEVAQFQERVDAENYGGELRLASAERASPETSPEPESSGGPLASLVLVPDSGGSAATARVAATGVGDPCARLPDGLDSAQLAAEALLVAWRRTIGVKPPRLDDTSSDVMVENGWRLGGNVAPFWETRRTDFWKDRFFRAGYALEEPFDLPTVRHLLNRHVGLAAARNLVTDSMTPPRPGEAYVRFVIARGLCALPGPHEVPRLDSPEVEQVFRYTYPRVQLPYPSRLKEMWGRKPPKRVVQHRQRLRAADATLYDPRLVNDTALAEATSNEKHPGDFAHNAMRATEGHQPPPAPGQEPARQVNWAPVRKASASEEADYQLDTSLLAVNYSRAAVLEHLLVFLAQLLQSRYGGAARTPPSEERVARTLRAIAAVTKLRQMSSLACVAHASEEESRGLMLEPDPNHLLVTRPPVVCQDAAPNDDERPTRMLYPADAGLRQFRGGSGLKPTERDAGPLERYYGDPNDGDAFSGRVQGCSLEDGAAHMLEPVTATGHLREGLGADPGDGEGRVDTSRLNEGRMVLPADAPRARADLYLGRSAESTPFLRAAPRARRVWGVASRVPEQASNMENMERAVLAGIEALTEEQQIECEEEMLQRLQAQGSAEQLELFSLTPSAEIGSRDRRAGLWQEALREIAVGSDLLHRFVRMLSGGLNEQVSDLLHGEDPDVLRLQQQVREQRRETAKRSIAFQARMIEQVLGGIFKSSTLSLDLAEHRCVGDGRDNHLMVRSAVAKQALKEAATGSGRPFFEATVQLHNMLEGGQGEIALKDMMRELLHLGDTFNERLGEELNGMTGGARLSREALALPRNSYMIRLNDTVCTAIWDTFVELSRRLRQHSHLMRRVYLWELVEGPSASTSSIFAELVRAQLQFTRATDTSATAYVSQVMKSSIAFKLELSYRKMINELCTYLYRFGTPNFAVRLRGATGEAPAVPEKPAGGGSDADDGDNDDDDDVSTGTPRWSLDAKVVDRLWTDDRAQWMKRAELARADLDAQRPPRVSPMAGPRQPPAPAHQFAWLGNLFAVIKTLGPNAAKDCLAKLLRTVFNGLQHSDWYIGRYDNADLSARYYSYLKGDLRKQVVAISRLVGNMRKDVPRGKRLIQFDDAARRDKPSLSTLTSLRDQLGHLKYRLELPANQLSSTLFPDEQAISKALNEMYELPGPEECDSAEWKDKLRWVPMNSARDVWERFVWDEPRGDEYHRGIADRNWGYMDKYFRRFGNVVGGTVWHMVALFAFCVLVLDMYNKITDVGGGGFTGAASAILNIMYECISGGYSLAASAAGFVWEFGSETLKFTWDALRQARESWGAAAPAAAAKGGAKEQKVEKTPDIKDGRDAFFKFFGSTGEVDASRVQEAVQEAAQNLTPADGTPIKMAANAGEIVHVVGLDAAVHLFSAVGSFLGFVGYWYPALRPAATVAGLTASALVKVQSYVGSSLGSDASRRHLESLFPGSDPAAFAGVTAMIISGEATRRRKKKRPPESTGHKIAAARVDAGRPLGRGAEGGGREVCKA